MSARPDLTTEELIAFVEEHARIRRSWVTPRLKDDVEARAENIERIREAIRFEAIAQRLRSERPAVTPEMYDLMRGKMAKPPVHGPQEDFRCACDACLEAALSVSSTKGKP